MIPLIVVGVFVVAVIAYLGWRLRTEEMVPGGSDGQQLFGPLSRKKRRRGSG